MIEGLVRVNLNPEDVVFKKDQKRDADRKPVPTIKGLKVPTSDIHSKKDLNLEDTRKS